MVCAQVLNSQIYFSSFKTWGPIYLLLFLGDMQERSSAFRQSDTNQRSSGRKNLQSCVRVGRNRTKTQAQILTFCTYCNITIMSCNFLSLATWSGLKTNHLCSCHIYCCPPDRYYILFLSKKHFRLEDVSLLKSHMEEPWAIPILCTCPIPILYAIAI